MRRLGWIAVTSVLACGRIDYVPIEERDLGTDPLALTDDAFTLAFDAPPTRFDVVRNDDVERARIAALTLIGSPGAFVIDNSDTLNAPGDDMVLFTPPPWAHGPYQATYRVLLEDGRTGTARIVVTVPCMSVDESTAGEIRVEAVGRYAVVFEEARFWEVGRWYDLLFDPEQDLGGNDSPGQMKYQVLHQLIAVRGPAGWVNIGSGPAQRPIVTDAGVSSVAIETHKILRRDGQADVFVSGLHTFDRDGNWSVASQAIPDAPSMDVVRWEYAMSTANPELS